MRKLTKQTDFILTLTKDVKEGTSKYILDRINDLVRNNTEVKIIDLQMELYDIWYKFYVDKLLER